MILSRKFICLIEEVLELVKEKFKLKKISNFVIKLELDSYRSKRIDG